MDLKNNICVLGLGYVGLPLAVLLAKKSGCVYGVERRKEIVDRLNNKITHLYEPGLDLMLSDVLDAGAFFVSDEIPENCKKGSTTYIITVGTPLDDQGRARMDMIENVCHEIAAVLKDGDAVILRSTVKPGTTSMLCKRIFDETGVHYSLSFCPERIAEGKALEELERLPNIIGSETDDGYQRTSEIFQLLNDECIPVSSIEVAEVIKVINNMSRDLMFAFSNEIGLICEQLGIDASEVMSAATSGYPRTSLPVVGLVGGPCLTKDIFMLTEALEGYDLSPTLGVQARSINSQLPIHGASYLAGYMQNQPKPIILGILGVAFKGRPATGDVRGTMVTPFLNAFCELAKVEKVIGFDPDVKNEDWKALEIHQCLSLLELFQQASVVIVMTSHETFDTIDYIQISHDTGFNGVMYDFWPQSKKLIGTDLPFSYLAYGQGKGNNSG